MKNIYEAIARGRLDNVVIYLSQGIDINTFDSNKNTLLMYSIKSRVSDISQYLIVNNIDIHVRNIQGETALDMAIKTRQLETAKLLVIKFSVESKYIDSDFNTTIEIVINKLVTTLLYKSQRYSWNSQCCQELRYYICSLDSNFSNYTKEQYNRYISARETRSGDFFGSYLSDDSDSEEESIYKNLTDKKSVLLLRRRMNIKEELRSIAFYLRERQVIMQKEL